MKTNRHLLVLGVLAAIGLSTAVAQATPIVVVSGGFASAVDNLNVDGTLYDVTFDLSTIDQTFQGNPSGALDAANALAPLLNAAGAVNVQGPSFTANGFAIADDSLGDGPTVGDPPAIVGNWSVNIFGAGPPYAEFAAVPEPATLALFASGLLALGAVRRRSRQAQKAAFIAS
jgi:hypothetical protein